MNGQAGKGSRRRRRDPRYCTRKQYDQNHDRAFGKKTKEKTK